MDNNSTDINNTNNDLSPHTITLTLNLSPYSIAITISLSPQTIEHTYLNQQYFL
jgi:hypothetical protein